MVAEDQSAPQKHVAPGACAGTHAASGGSPATPVAVPEAHAAADTPGRSTPVAVLEAHAAAAKPPIGDVCYIRHYGGRWEGKVSEEAPPFAYDEAELMRHCTANATLGAIASAHEHQPAWFRCVQQTASMQFSRPHTTSKESMLIAIPNHPLGPRIKKVDPAKTAHFERML